MKRTKGIKTNYFVETTSERIHLQCASNILCNGKMERVFMTFQINLLFWWNSKFYASNTFQWKCENTIFQIHRDKDAQCAQWPTLKRNNGTAQLNSRAVQECGNYEFYVILQTWVLPYSFFYFTPFFYLPPTMSLNICCVKISHLNQPATNSDSEFHCNSFVASKRKKGGGEWLARSIQYI